MTTVQAIVDASNIEYPIDVIEVKEEQQKKLWTESARNTYTVDDINPGSWPLWTAEIKNIVRELITKVRTELGPSPPAAAAADDDLGDQPACDI